VLDAIYLVCKELLKQNVLGEIIKRRAQRVVGGSELWYGFDSDNNIQFNLRFNNADWKLIIYREGGMIKRSCKYPLSSGVIEPYGYYRFSDLSFYSHGSIPNIFGEEGGERQYFEKLRMFYSLYREDELRDDLERTIGEVLQNVELQEDLQNRAKEIYGKLSVSFIPRRENQRDIKLTIEQEGYRVFADFHGDGVKRGLLILASLEILSNTGLLIEEIEINQHPKALKNLVKHMVDLARRNNVQLFITTHSYYDALRYFYYAFEPKQREKEFRCILLRRHKGVVEAEIREDIEEVIRELYPS